MNCIQGQQHKIPWGLLSCLLIKSDCSKPCEVPETETIKRATVLLLKGREKGRVSIFLAAEEDWEGESFFALIWVHFLNKEQPLYETWHLWDHYVA